MRPSSAVGSEHPIAQLAEDYVGQALNLVDQLIMSFTSDLFKTDPVTTETGLDKTGRAATSDLSVDEIITAVRTMAPSPSEVWLPMPVYNDRINRRFSDIDIDADLNDEVMTREAMKRAAEYYMQRQETLEKLDRQPSTQRRIRQRRQDREV